MPLAAATVLAFRNSLRFIVLDILGIPPAGNLFEGAVLGFGETTPDKTHLHKTEARIQKEWRAMREVRNKGLVLIEHWKRLGNREIRKPQNCRASRHRGGTNLRRKYFGQDDPGDRPYREGKARDVDENEQQQPCRGAFMHDGPAH